MQALRWESSLLEAYGQDQRAAQTARRGLIAAGEAGLARTFGAAHAINLVNALIPPGEWDAAAEIIEDVLELAPPPAYRAHLQCLRGGIALARGDLATAEDGVLAAHDLATGGHFAQDVLLLPQLETELRLTQGRLTDAVTIIERTLAKTDLRPISRFSWPLLTTGARVAAALPHQREADRAALLEELTAQAQKLPTIGPLQHAHRLTFAAEAGYATGQHNQAAWDTTATAWDQLGHPYRLARALLRAAEAAITAENDRAAATPRLRRAAELAARLNAEPLHEQIERLARRARITLDHNSAHPTGDPTEQTRRNLGLSTRELEVLQLITAGHSNRDIARKLFISPKTASVHVSHILTKLGVSARGEAAATAYRLGLFDDTLT
jgi:ATP/maltotriose-dependent transcriptional regulator MalT